MSSRLERRLWLRTMTLLKKDHRKATPALKEAIKRAIQPCSEEVLRQVDRDLDLYPLWDAISMWCQDSPVALGEFHPKLREVVAKLVGKAEEGVLTF